MGETDRSDVLRRKARSGREEHQARVMSPPRALRLAMARAADELFDLALAVSAIRLEQVSQAEAIAAFHDTDLLMVLDGPGGAIGAASIEMPILAGLIEMQTMGTVLPTPADARLPTQTDAALVAPLLDASLEGLVENLEGEAEAGWAEGVRFGARVESTRMLSLLVEAADFHLFRLTVALGEAAKEGGIVIALPVLLPQQGTALCEDAAEGDTRPRLGQGALLAARAPLTAVLHRVSMPLAEISRLKPGDRLAIPREALNDTRLEAGNKSGMRSCHLGQINGLRAVRLGAADADGRRHGAGLDSGAEESAQTGAGLRALPGGLPGEMADLSEAELERLIAEAEAGGGTSAGVPDAGAPEQEGANGTAPEMPEPPGVAEEGAELPDLPDLGDLGDLGDLSDLPELALGEQH